MFMHKIEPDTPLLRPKSDNYPREIAKLVDTINVINNMQAGELGRNYRKLHDSGYTDAEILKGTIAVLAPYLKDSVSSFKAGQLETEGPVDVQTDAMVERLNKSPRLSEALLEIVQDLTTTITTLTTMVAEAAPDGHLIEPIEEE